jgi:hypothetical protein
MKKVITSLIIVFAFVTLQAQTSIPLTNGDCSTTAGLTGSTPYVISGYTIAHTGGTLTPASSGLIGGALKIVGTANGTQGQLTITTDKVDISSYPIDATFSYSCKLTCGTATSQAQPYNVIIIAYAADGITVVTPNTLTFSKVQPNTNVTSQVTIGATAVMKANTVTPGSDAKYIVFQLQMGKMLTNNLTFDDFTLTQLGEPPVTVTGTPSNADLSYEVENGPSTESTFTVSGTGLGTDAIVLTPGTNLEISLNSGSNFVANPSTISLTPTSGAVTSTTIYTRLKSGINGLGAVGASSARITVFHSTAGTKTVQFTGTVKGLAVSNPVSTTITYTEGAGPSTEETLNVSGLGLTTDVVLTPGANIEISTTPGSGFASSPITLIQAAGAVASTPIYARLIAGLIAGSYNDATTKLTASSTGFISIEKQFKGTVNGIAMSNPVSTALYYAQGLGPSAERAFNVSGSGLTADIDITPGANIEISLTSGSGFVSTPIILTQIAGSVASTPIYARLIAGLSPATYNDATTKVTTSSTGLTSKELQFVGTVDLGTGIANKNISNLKCIAAKGTINVIGVEVGKQIDIYNNVGQKAKSVTATNNTVITLSVKGIYFVKVDALVEKVILK